MINDDDHAVISHNISYSYICHRNYHLHLPPRFSTSGHVDHQLNPHGVHPQAAGFKVAPELHTSGAAFLHQENGDPLPSMSWPSNYDRLGSATMFSLTGVLPNMILSESLAVYNICI